MVKSYLEKRQRKIGFLILGAAVGAGVAAGSLVRWGGTWPSITIFAGLLVIFSLAVLAMIPWWRSLDHMQRDAQYSSWYWGGTAGAAAVFGAVLAFSGIESAMTRGAILMSAGQVLGFGLFWLIWRLRYGGGNA